MKIVSRVLRYKGNQKMLAEHQVKTSLKVLIGAAVVALVPGFMAIGLALSSALIACFMTVLVFIAAVQEKEPKWTFITMIVGLLCGVLLNVNFGMTSQVSYFIVPSVFLVLGFIADGFAHFGKQAHS